MPFQSTGTPAKMAWLQNNLVCLKCNATGLAESDTGWSCPRCGQGFTVYNRAISFIDEKLAEETKTNATNRVSAHAYSQSSLDLIDAARAAGGMALDCGAGSREFVADHLIQVEITPYDNIDVLAVNQRLPFPDSSFDVVMSYDVLEHVTDPFQSARELSRVLKPGGVLHVNVPFLQTEHGYPHHFFNMTRMGLRQLFDGLLDCEAHVVPNSGHPAATVWFVLTAFRGMLHKADRVRFESMTVNEILGSDAKTLVRMFEVADEAKWQAASATQALFRKPGKGQLRVKAENLPVFKRR